MFLVVLGFGFSMSHCPHAGAEIKGANIAFESIRFEPYFNKRHHSTCQRVACQSGCKMQLPSHFFSHFLTPVYHLPHTFPALETYFSNESFLCRNIKIAGGSEGVTHLSPDM